MKEPAKLAGDIHSVPAETGGSLRRHRVLLLCVVVWTLFTGAALWWLFTKPAPSVWIVRQRDSSKNAPGPADTERFHAWFKADSGFQRVYPWVLLGPYVALLASSFPLERGRLRLSLPINIVACAAFIAACHLINVRTNVTFAKVTVIKWQGDTDLATGHHETSRLEYQILQDEAESPPQEPTANGGAAMPSPGDGGLAGMVIRRQGYSDASLTNLFVQGFKHSVPPPGMPTLGIWPSLLDLLAYGAVVGLAHSVHFYRRFREREHRAVFLESNLANARLNALRAQLQPHFLFNSLNAIVALLRRDPRLAEATLLSLSELLRLTLSQSEKQEVALREEIQVVQRYLQIQQTRFGDKLRVEEDIEPAALDCLVPTLLLQPLVENAIRHGIEPAENAGLVRLTARRQDAMLVITVQDDGVGLREPANVQTQPKTNLEASSDSLAGATSATLAASEGVKGGTGIGLTNLRTRLETLYGSRQQLELVPGAERGLTVRIQIPCRPARTLETAGVPSCA